VVGPNLFPTHTAFSTFALHDAWRPATPGYLWQLMAHLVNLVVPSADPRPGAVIATVVAAGLFGVALFDVFRWGSGRSGGMPWSWAAALSVGVALLETPGALHGWQAFTGSGVFFTLYIPYAPTSAPSFAVNVYLLHAVAGLVSGQLEAGKRWVIPALVVVASVVEMLAAAVPVWEATARPTPRVAKTPTLATAAPTRDRAAG